MGLLAIHIIFLFWQIFMRLFSITMDGNSFCQEKGNANYVMDSLDFFSINKDHFNVP